MTGKTHRVGGVLCVLGGYTLLESNGLLLGNVSPLVQLVVMYPFAIYGSTVSDLDHNWHSSPSKDVVSLAINKVLHLTNGVVDRVGENTRYSKFLSIFDAKHRSWQTHSDLFLALMVIISAILIKGSAVTSDALILRLISIGLILGIISHLFLDMLTPEGIWSITSTFIRKVSKNKLVPQKISLVPDSVYFRTGGEWEKLVRSVMWVLCLILFLKIAISMSPYGFTFLKG